MLSLLIFSICLVMMLHQFYNKVFLSLCLHIIQPFTCWSSSVFTHHQTKHQHLDISLISHSTYMTKELQPPPYYHLQQTFCNSNFAVDNFIIHIFHLSYLQYFMIAYSFKCRKVCTYLFTYYPCFAGI